MVNGEENFGKEFCPLAELKYDLGVKKVKKVIISTIYIHSNVTKI